MRAKSKGFTLIELMIVVAIIAAAVVTAMPYLTSRNSETRVFLRQFTVLSRELHTRAKLHGVAYRLVIDMSDPGDGTRKVEHKYWVEKANGKVVLKENEEEDALKREEESDEEAKKDPRGFSMDNSMVKEPKSLPAGLRFDRVELTRLKSPLTDGKAYIHYLPQGLVDGAAVHIKGEKEQAWTIAIHPLTGKAELISKSLSPKEISSQ